MRGSRRIFPIPENATIAAIFHQLAFRWRFAYAAKFKHVCTIVRIVLKALLAVTAFAVVVVSVCLCWFYFYSGDLPNFSMLAKFAPDSPATVGYQCSDSPVQVIPSTFVSKNLRNAARAAEGKNDEVFARQISFDLFCDSQSRMLRRHVLEYKASVQLRRRFTPEQLLTIYLNRATSEMISSGSRVRLCTTSGSMLPTWTFRRRR
jgi:hypothetical protein